MLKLVFTLILTISMFDAFAQDHPEVHFDGNLESKCVKEVSALGCGMATSENEETFLSCVDKKVTSLSIDCQNMHRIVRNQKHKNK